MTTVKHSSELPPEGLPGLLVERPALTNRLHTALSDSNSPPVVLIGPPGSGKTSLVATYLQKHAGAFSRVTLLSARDLDLHPDDSSHGIPALLHARLPAGGGRHLLVLDDLDALPRATAQEVVSHLYYQRQRSPGLALLLVARPYTIHWLFDSAFVLNFLFLNVPLPSLDELQSLVSRRLASVPHGEDIVRTFFGGITERGLSLEHLRPHFTLELLRRYLRSANLDRSLSDLSQTYFLPVSSLVLAPLAAGPVLVLPVAEGAPIGLRASSGSLLPGSTLSVVKNARNLWLKQVEEFESLIARDALDERTLQEFFESCPHFLRGLDYAEVYPQIVLEREDDEGSLIPDFLLRPVFSPYVDILDLKLPRERLVVGSKDRKHFAASVHSAIAQVREYRDYFDRPEFRERLHDKYGITAYRPRCIVVIGRRPTDLTEEKLRQLFDALPRYLSIVTYDDLLARMKEQAFQHSA